MSARQLRRQRQAERAEWEAAEKARTDRKPTLVGDFHTGVAVRVWQPPHRALLWCTTGTDSPFNLIAAAGG